MAGAFSEQPRILLENDDFTVTAFRYASGSGKDFNTKQPRSSGDSATDGASDFGADLTVMI